MKIAVMGSAPSSRHQAPFDDPEWEIWCCSPPNFDLPRVDAWFELHNLDRKFSNKRNKPYVDTLVRHPRVYIAQPDPRLPQGIVLPWQDLVAKYGPDFFTSSVAWMLASAIEQKPEKIGLWGVDMSASEEYGNQRQGCKFFIREARKQGIGIYAPPTSDILAPMPLYAIKEHWPSWIKLKTRQKELQERFASAESAVENATHDMDLFKGALDDLRYQENTWLHPEWLTEREATPHEPMDPQPENADKD
jgi:hypothetical protein